MSNENSPTPKPVMPLTTYESDAPTEICTHMGELRKLAKAYKANAARNCTLALEFKEVDREGPEG
jgi:hypothetical protein